ncbi:GSCOCG00002660001-RA-CDS [Cotesia congregata]|nr:GSCOCG00002660001-RA-CDS [Cotesia congregata]
MGLPTTKKNRENLSNELREAASSSSSDDTKNYLDKIFGDISKTSATKQIVIGTTSGWMTGFLAMKVGKIAAFSVGGGIIILQIAVHQGYIKVNWDKIQKKAEKVSDTLEEKITGEGPKFLDKYYSETSDNLKNFLKIQFLEVIKFSRLSYLKKKYCQVFANFSVIFMTLKLPCVLQVERFVDKKLDKAEDYLKSKKAQGHRWYEKFLGTDNANGVFKPKEMHFFVVSFVAGVLIGSATASY